MLSPERAKVQPQKHLTESHKKILYIAAGAGCVAGTFLLGGCATETQAKAAPVTVVMSAQNIPSTFLDPNRPYHNRVVESLKPGTGNKIAFLEGEFEIHPSVNRRLAPSKPLYEDCSGLKDNKFFCDRGVDYIGGLRSEIVQNPLWQVVDGRGFLTFFSPRHGKVVTVAVVEGDTDDKIKWNGILVKDLGPVAWETLRQTAIVEELRFDSKDPQKRPKVLVRRQDGKIEEILQSQESKILGRF